MAQFIADRLIWAVDMLAVNPSDRLLEIGCGRGTAVSLICMHLVDGMIAAIDQSEKTIHIAKNRNAVHVTAGKASFYTASFHEADLGQNQFNKIFAVNVNLFWKKADCELGIIKKRLLPGGAVYLFYQPPAAVKLQHIADHTKQNLLSAGYGIKQIIVGDQNPVPVIGVIATIVDNVQNENGS